MKKKDTIVFMGISVILLIIILTVIAIEATETDSLNYESYRKKIWVVDSWDGGAYSYPCSFFITKIEKGFVSGMIRTRSVAYPDFFSRNIEQSQYLDYFSGEIHHGVAQCRFEDKDGNKGIVTLRFKENNEILATTEYTIKEPTLDDYFLDGTYYYRPLNLSDMDIVYPQKTQMIEIDFDSWGNVYFANIIVQHKNPCPNIFLVNKSGDVFYKFKVPFSSGTEYVDFSIMDINGDGLKDVRFVNDFDVEYTILQMDTGLFYLSEIKDESGSWRLIDELNTSN